MKRSAALLSVLFSGLFGATAFAQNGQSPILPVTGSKNSSFTQNAQQANNPTSPSLIGQQKAITTAVPFLAITPDSRHAALGDAGVATSPDANSAYWNAGKLVFVNNDFGGSFSVNPWLRKIVNDMWITSLAGFYKISQEQAIAGSFRYFNLGEISFRDEANQPLGDFSPKEAAFDVTYSRKLSEKLGVGLTGRYIFSNLTGAFSGSDAQAANTVGADIGVYYTSELRSARNSVLSLGAQISNIGPKISYTDNDNRDFLPTNLKLGGALTNELSPNNTLTFLLDFNKLMVPSVENDQTVLSGMFGSFSDAPGGGSEELKEIMTSVGFEYWYAQTFAARLGYFNEAKEKGNRKYLTFGIGFHKDTFGFDGAYVVPTNQREHPLAETWRITAFLHFPSSNLRPQESVTD